jgi:hypothetical protein
VPLGPSTFDLSVDHIAGAQDPAITSVAVGVRATGTKKWTTLTVTPDGPDHYVVSFNARPAQEGAVFDLRITVSDAAGGLLRRYTEAAFLVS